MTPELIMNLAFFVSLVAMSCTSVNMRGWSKELYLDPMFSLIPMAVSLAWIFVSAATHVGLGLFASIASLCSWSVLFVASLAHLLGKNK